VVALSVGEVELRDHAAGLRGVVLLDRRLEPLPQGLWLAELAAQPTQQADIRRAV
jgi:hypothetical protein